MALTVATNTGALMAQAAASSVNKEMEMSMERLATGKRINGASDDAAGVAIASRLHLKFAVQTKRSAMRWTAGVDRYCRRCASRRLKAFFSVCVNLQFKLSTIRTTLTIVPTYSLKWINYQLKSIAFHLQLAGQVKR